MVSRVFGRGAGRLRVVMPGAVIMQLLDLGTTMYRQSGTDESNPVMHTLFLAVGAWPAMLAAKLVGTVVLVVVIALLARLRLSAALFTARLVFLVLSLTVLGNLSNLVAMVWPWSSIAYARGLAVFAVTALVVAGCLHSDANKNTSAVA